MEIDIEKKIDEICDQAELAIRADRNFPIQEFVEKKLKEHQEIFQLQDIEDVRRRLSYEINAVYRQIQSELAEVTSPYHGSDDSFNANNAQEERLNDLEETTRANSSLVICPQCGYANAPVAKLGNDQGFCKQCGCFVGEEEGLEEQNRDSTMAYTGDGMIHAISNRFEIKKKLGKGGYGIVFLAWDRKLARDVAIKIPRMDRLQRDVLLREARAASQLKHPYIVRIFDVGEIDERTYIVSDYVDGQPLSRWPNRNLLNDRQACSMMIKIAEAIEHAHQNGVIHRDLKLGNIMVDQSENPQVLDFGLSHSRINPMDSIARSGLPIGTPAYMAPEQAEGNVAKIGPWSDIYALGVMLYQFLTNELPFRGTSDSILEEIVNHPVRPPSKIRPGMPVALEAIVLKCLAKEPQDRYQTAAQLANDLQRFLDNKTVAAYPRLEARVVLQQVRNWAVPTLLVGVSIVFLAMLAWRQYQHAAANPTTQFLVNSNVSSLNWIPFDQQTLDWDEDKGVILPTGKVQRLPPGFYKVTMFSDGKYHEVYRTIPDPLTADSIQTDPIYSIMGVVEVHHLKWNWEGSIARLPDIHWQGAASTNHRMVYVGGGTIDFPQEAYLPVELAGQQFQVKPFLIDQYEVTVGEFFSIFPNAEIARNADDQPVAGINWDLAVAYAEKVEKQLPRYEEMIFVATNGGTTRYPWGDQVPPEEDWSQVDRNLFEPPVFRLLTSKSVWCSNRVKARIVTQNQVSQRQTKDPGDPDKRYLFGFHGAEYSNLAAALSKLKFPPFYRNSSSQVQPRFGLRLVSRLSP